MVLGVPSCLRTRAASASASIGLSWKPDAPRAWRRAQSGAPPTAVITIRGTNSPPGISRRCLVSCTCYASGHCAIRVNQRCWASTSIIDGYLTVGTRRRCSGFSLRRRGTCPSVVSSRTAHAKGVRVRLDLETPDRRPCLGAAKSSPLPGAAESWRRGDAARLAEERHQARQERMSLNRSRSCEACSDRISIGSQGGGAVEAA